LISLRRGSNKMFGALNTQKSNTAGLRPEPSQISGAIIINKIHKNTKRTQEARKRAFGTAAMELIPHWKSETMAKEW